MLIMRLPRLATLTLAVAAGVLLAPDAGEAQMLRFGVHVPFATGLGGGDDLTEASFGIGARVGLEAPLFPLSFWGTADYMFPGGEGASYQNFALDANFALPIPLLEPYVTGGYQGRRFDDGSSSDFYNGWTVGGGIRFSFIVNAFLEARREFYGDDRELVGDDDQWLIRLGIIF
jgi:hypothetical protein